MARTYVLGLQGDGRNNGVSATLNHFVGRKCEVAVDDHLEIQHRRDGRLERGAIGRRYSLTETDRE